MQPLMQMGHIFKKLKFRSAEQETFGLSLHNSMTLLLISGFVFNVMLRRKGNCVFYIY